MNKTDVYAEFDIDDSGIIRTPGMFEAESWIAPIVYSWYMDGDPGEWIGETNIYVVSGEDRTALELSETTYALTLSVSEQGFVYVGELDQSEYEQINEEEFSDEFGD